MATKALSLVTERPEGLLLIQLVEEMTTLRGLIADIVGPNDGIDLALGKDGLSFVATITLKPDSDGKIAAHMLERQMIPGCHITKVGIRPVPHTVTRRVIKAHIVSPLGDA